MHQNNNKLDCEGKLNDIANNDSKASWQTPKVTQITARNTEGKSWTAGGESTEWQGPS